VRRSRTTVDFAVVDGALRFFLDICVTVDAVQFPDGWGEVSQEMLGQLEAATEQTLSKQVRELAERLRDEGHDVLGFAETIRQRDIGLWEQIVRDAGAWVAESEIDVHVEVRIRDSGMVR